MPSMVSPRSEAPGRVPRPNNDLRFPVDRQGQWVSGFLEAIEKLRRVSFEVTEGSYVVGNVQHQFLTKFASNYDRSRDLRIPQPQRLPNSTGGAPAETCQKSFAIITLQFLFSRVRVLSTRQ